MRNKCLVRYVLVRAIKFSLQTYARQNTCRPLAGKPFCQSVHDFLFHVGWHIPDSGLMTASWLHIHAHVLLFFAVEPCAYTTCAPWVNLSIYKYVGGVFFFEELYRPLVECVVKIVSSQTVGQHDFFQIALSAFERSPLFDGFERIAVVTQFAACLHIERHETVGAIRLLNQV